MAASDTSATKARRPGDKSVRSIALEPSTYDAKTE